MPDIEELSARMLDAIERLRGLLVDPQPGLASWHDAVRQAMEAVAREMPPSVLTAGWWHSGPRNPREEVLTAQLHRSWREMLRGHVVQFAVHSGAIVHRAWVEDHPRGYVTEHVLRVRVEQQFPAVEQEFPTDMKCLDVYLVPPHVAVRDDLFVVGAAAGMPIAVPREFVREPST